MDASSRGDQIADLPALRFAGAAGEAVYKMVMHYPDGFG